MATPSNVFIRTSASIADVAAVLRELGYPLDQADDGGEPYFVGVVDGRRVALALNTYVGKELEPFELEVEVSGQEAAERIACARTIFERLVRRGMTVLLTDNIDMVLDRHDPDLVRAVIAEHEAGRLSWDAYVDAMIAALGTRYERTLLDALHEAKEFCRLGYAIFEKVPDHWLRGVGDNGAAEDMLELADRDLD